MSDAERPAWDFYPCHIDGAPASIFLDFRHEHATRPPTADTLYRVRVQMLDPDEHGMGTPDEATAFNALEETVSDHAIAAELIYVGRIRSGAQWELAFYGPPDRKDALQAIREQFGERRTYSDVRRDADWGYYREFLLPDAERRQWMEDRRLTDVLREHGDTLAKPRRVDHWAYFGSEDARDRFVRAAAELGFELHAAARIDGIERPFVAQVHRIDAVELDHIHDVVMELHDLATAEDGAYDGWECPTETSNARA
jgi:regulator of RNase E activity RraB